LFFRHPNSLTSVSRGLFSTDARADERPVTLGTPEGLPSQAAGPGEISSEGRQRQQLRRHIESLPFETAANAKEATESYGAYRPPDASIGVSTRFPREFLNVAGLSVKVSKLVAHEALGGSPLRGV
jgi:hypothetical protein